jgi:hypothetical protein
MRKVAAAGWCLSSSLVKEGHLALDKLLPHWARTWPATSTGSR